MKSLLLSGKEKEAPGSPQAIQKVEPILSISSQRPKAQENRGLLGQHPPWSTLWLLLDPGPTQNQPQNKPLGSED